MVVTVDVIVASGVSITFIVMLSSPVQPFCVTVYVIVCSPAPAVSGLNVPFVWFVIPVPDQVPPVGVAVKELDGSVEQKSPGSVIFIVGVGFTIIEIEFDAPQVPAIV